MIACLFIYFRNGKCLTNEFFKGCGKEIQFTLSTENIIYIMTIMAFWASMHCQRNSVFLLPTVITMLDGGGKTVISLCSWWERSVEESFGRRCCKDIGEWGRDASKTVMRKNNSAS